MKNRKSPAQKNRVTLSLTMSARKRDGKKRPLVNVLDEALTKLEFIGGNSACSNDPNTISRQRARFATIAIRALAELVASQGGLAFPVTLYPKPRRFQAFRN